jgi:hypothetical protein
MFKVGKYYKVVTWEPGEDGGKIHVSPPSRVVDVSLPHPLSSSARRWSPTIHRLIARSQASRSDAYY